MKTFPNTLALAAMTATAALATSSGMAFAQSVGEIATQMSGQVTNLSTLVTVIAFVVGVCLTMAGLFKFRQHTKNPNDPSASMGNAFILVFVGAALVAIPAVLGSGIQTVFGSGAETTDATGGFNSLR